jgi:hypothetical protein
MAGREDAVGIARVLSLPTPANTTTPLSTSESNTRV